MGTNSSIGFHFIGGWVAEQRTLLRSYMASVYNLCAICLTSVTIPRHQTLLSVSDSAEPMSCVTAPGPGVSSRQSPHCDTRPGPERVSVLSWLSPGTHRYTNAISDQNITSLTSLMTETCFKQSWQIVMVSWQESRSRWERLPWGQVNKSVLCDKLDVPDSDWIDHISR